MLLVWAPGWYLTYHYWPTSYNSHTFEGTLYFVPAEERPRERLRQELAAVTFKEYALQDGNTLEATQSMIESRVVHRVPAQRPGDPPAPPPQDGARPRRRPPEAPARDAGHASRRPPEEPLHDHDPPRRRSPTSSRSPTGRSRTEAERYAKRLASSDGRAPGVLRRRLPAARPPPWPTSTSSTSTRCPTMPSACCGCRYSLVNVSFPVEVWRQPRVPDSGAATMDVVVEPSV